jgi:hypothetical protein
VNLLTTLVRSLGNDRALANAGATMEAMKREDWIIQGLSLRLDRLPGPASRPAAISATG